MMIALGLDVLVADLRRTPDEGAGLLALLRDDAAWHAGLPSTVVDRSRGTVLAAFARTGLPAAAVSHVVEALEAGEVAEEVAGAALALRGATASPPRIAASLGRAFDNRAGRDAPAQIDGHPPTTVVTEIVRALGRLVPHDPVAAEILDEIAWEMPWTALLAGVGIGGLGGVADVGGPGADVPEIALPAPRSGHEPPVGTLQAV